MPYASNAELAENSGVDRRNAERREEERLVWSGKPGRAVGTGVTDDSPVRID